MRMLYGDSGSNGRVDANDQLGIVEDLNGDGRVDSKDKRDARNERNKAIDAALLSLLDD